MSESRPRARSRPPARPRPPKRRLGAVVAAVRPVAERLAAERSLVLWGVEFVREAGREVLRVHIDHEGRVSSDELSQFAEAFSRLLDETDAVPGNSRYILEVTSPGAERKLGSPEQFAVCRGRDVRITFKDGRPPLEGVIARTDEDEVVVQAGEVEAVVPFPEISQARLIVRGA